MLFDTWGSVGYAAVRAAIAYLVIVVALRGLGAKALGKLTAYDLVLTIALASLLASIPLSETTLADAVAAMLVLVALGAGLRWGKRVQRPRLVVWKGELLRDRLARWRIREDEVTAAVRRAGVAAIAEVQAVVLENDGAWSVIRRVDCGVDRSALAGLEPPS